MTARDDFDPLAPQREAAFFYGLFLRGHDVDTLREDIDVPRSMDVVRDRVLTDSTARGRGYFESEAVDAVLEAHMSGLDRSTHVYAMLMLELWHREVLDTPSLVAT